MRKIYVYLSCLVVCVFSPLFIVAQMTINSDSTLVWVSLPKNFDFSSIPAATITLATIMTALWTVITGYFSSKWLWITRVTVVLNNAARRVAAFGFLSSFFVALYFGFSKDAQTALFAAFLTLVGTFTGMGFFDTFLKKTTDKINTTA